MNSIRPTNNTITINLFNEWINYLDTTPKTKQIYTRAIRQFNNYLIDENIKQPTRNTIINFKDKLMKSKAINTVNSYLIAIKQFFNWTELCNIYPNISKGIKTIKNNKNFKKDYLTVEQIKQVLNSIDTTNKKGLRDYTIILLMVANGLRVSEIKNINVSDIKPKGNNIVIYIKGKGHAEKDDYIKLSSQVQQIIYKYINMYNLDQNSPLFTSLATNGKGDRLSDRSISKIVKEIFKANNLNSDKLTAHSLRHTTATINLLSGGTLEDTRQLLRHSNISTTQIYTHQIEKDNNNSHINVSSALFE